MTKLIKKGVRYLMNQDIDIRVRMIFFLEYATLLASIVGTVAMIACASSFSVLIPNLVLLIFCLFGLYISHAKGMYDIAAMGIVVGCAFLALPCMFFTAGGNKSGMPIWFIFGIVFISLMMKGKFRIIMPFISILISIVCMCIDYCKPELVKPLKNEQAVFVDTLQSFVIVTVVISISLMIYLSAYDRQRRNLEIKSNELNKAARTDSLTGIANRHAYYETSSVYTNAETMENLVLTAMDINGLKKVNDAQGHAAGDELIKDATSIMLGAYSKYGNIFRTGGDEFIGVLSCDDNEADKLLELIEAETKSFNERNKKNIAIATGVAIWNQNKDKNYFELEKLADSLMYKNKSKFYIESGMDRRKR